MEADVSSLKQPVPLTPERSEPPTLALAFSPLAFSTIVTPYGTAAVIILMAFAPDTKTSLLVAGVAYFILFLDWLAMLTAHILVRFMIAGISGLIAQGAFTGPGN